MVNKLYQNKNFMNMQINGYIYIMVIQNNNKKHMVL